MVVKMGWKNIWRNKLRSAVVIAAITFGVASGSFIIAFAWGSYQQRIDSAIRGEISNIQIHHPKFKDNYNPQFTVFESKRLIEQLEADARIKAVSPRLVFVSMASSARNNSPVKVNGVDKAKENATTFLEDKLLEGKILEGTKSKPVFIGQSLADKLQIRLKNKIVIPFLGADNEIVNMSFKVMGIFKSSNKRYDDLNVFVSKSDLEEALGYTPQDVHEIAITVNDAELELEVSNDYSSDQYVLETWKEIMPELRLAVESFDQMTGLIMIIIFLAIAFGIVNTMLMAVLERIRELGMLMAIGMNKRKIFLMIMSETVLMAVVGGVIGLCLAYVLVSFFGGIGIDLSHFSEGLSDLGFDTKVYPVMKQGYYLRTALQVVLVAFVASIYPARKALKLKPLDALRSV